MPSSDSANTQSLIAISLLDIAQQVTAMTTQIAFLQAHGQDATAELAAANALVTAAAAQMVIAQDAVKKAQAMLDEARGLGALLAQIVEIDAARKKVNTAVDGLVALEGGGGGGGGGGGDIPTDDPAILAEVTDHSLASVDNQLGPKASLGMILPNVWQRGQSPHYDSGFGVPFMGNFSTGLFVTGSGSFDYGSTSAQIVVVPDDPLVITDSVPNDGLGLYRLRTEEHSEGQVQTAPVVAWNGQLIDAASTGHIQSGLGAQLGVPFKVARGKHNRYDAGVCLYDESRGGVGYFGTCGTETAFAPWSGTTMLAGKIPLCIAVDTYSGFVYIGCHDRATGRGQLAIYWQWTGNDLQQLATGFGFPFDFPVAHPGLLGSGVVTGVKCFGYFDLPVKWPTSVDIVVENAGADRVQGPDGNASYLNIWPLDTAPQRADFLAQNSGWIPNWGKACVVSKYENKAVMIDCSALYAGVKDQYFGSQANYDQTAYTNPGGVWYQKYDINNPMTFPWGVAAKPSWAPVIGATVTLPSAPTSMLMSELGDARVAIGTADGNLRFYTFAGVAEDVVAVGLNPCHICHDKGPAGGGPRRGGAMGPIVTCRGARSIVFLDKWATGAAVSFTLQDSNMLDPVNTECADMHGAQARIITVCCFEDKTVRNYRLTDLTLATQSGAVFHMGPTDTDLVECGGVMNLPGHPFAVSGSNVN